MNFIEFIFKFIQRFTPMSTDRYNQMFRDADQWHQDIIKEPIVIDGEKKTNAFKKLYIENHSKWYLNLALAFAFPFLVKFMGDWLTKIDEEEDEDDKPKYKL